MAQSQPHGLSQPTPCLAPSTHAHALTCSNPQRRHDKAVLPLLEMKLRPKHFLLLKRTFPLLNRASWIIPCLWVVLLSPGHYPGGLPLLPGLAESRLRILKTLVQKSCWPGTHWTPLRSQALRFQTSRQEGGCIIFVPMFRIPAKLAANGRMALWGGQIMQWSHCALSPY